jgi:hypothetical protein
LREKWKISRSDGIRKITVNFDKEGNNLIIVTVFEKRRIIDISNNSHPERIVIRKDRLDTLDFLVLIMNRIDNVSSSLIKTCF